LLKNPRTPNPGPQIQSLWLDGFAEMTPQELDLLAALLPHCDRATLAFCLATPPETGTGHSWLSVWSAVAKTYQQCRQRLERLPEGQISVEWLKRDAKKSRFAGNSTLRHLEQNWSQMPGSKSESSAISLVVCANPEAEAVLAARAILRFVRHGGRFRDTAVMVRNLDGYHQPLARVFRRYAIPFFLDRRESVTHHPLAELTRSALRTVALDWPHDDWFAALKAGFAPVGEDDIDRLENESLARGWRGGKWLNPLVLSENLELEKSLERLRQKIVPPF